MTVMTRNEKAEVVERMLLRYEGLGSTIVDDDECLSRLLRTLEIGGDDREIGDYLHSFLTA
jgi:hypothetical protein